MTHRLALLSVAAMATATTACSEPAPEPAAEPPAPLGVYGTAPLPVGGTPSVVTLEPLEVSGGGAGVGSGTRDSAEPPTMDQLGLVFTPTTLIAHVGERVVFTNSETLVHNVHVTTTDIDSTVLDVETDPGARAEFVFDHPGGYDVTCDHHPGMRAFIYVTEAEHAVFSDVTGAFVIPDVPPGAYDLSIWSVDARLRSDQRIEVSGPSTEVILERP